MIKESIEANLLQNLNLQHIEVINESHMHNVPKGSESHFKVVLISDDFREKSLVMRHKMVYGILGEQLKNGVHALALHTYTAAEWLDKNGNIPDSPLCMGGSKRH